MPRTVVATSERIAGSIVILRDQRVLLDAELASLYGVSTKRFNEQVRRNRQRFPSDFMFQLSAGEVDLLRSQIATSKISGRGGRGYLPTPSPNTAQ
jgi:ORF6N domain